MKKKWPAILPALVLCTGFLSFQSAEAATLVSIETQVKKPVQSDIPPGYEAILNWAPEEQPTVKRGSHSFEVEFIQMMLGHFGFATEVDGMFGPHTEQQVRRLQAAHGLVPDGIVGIKTWTLIQNEFAAKTFRADTAFIIAEQFFGNDDLTFSSDGVLYEDADGKTFYTLKARSKDLSSGGGSGTVGFYDVYYDGDVVQACE